MKLIIFAIFLLLATQVQSQDCTDPIDTLVTSQCNFVTQTPPIPAGVAVTRCFVIIPETQFVNFGFILIQSPSCGPIAYSYLNYQLFESGCGNLISAGQIFPVPNNTNIVLMTYPDTLDLCLTWMPLCTQTSVCGSYSFSPLPVELISFQGRRELDRILLSWVTATEIDCEKYVIQKSTDFTSWTDLICVPGSGNSLSMQYYEAEDTKPSIGTNYYRLIQYDYSGDFELLKVIPVFYDAKTVESPLKGYNLLGQKIRK
jgi:hypothetical protein